jgi:transcriptional pleiotropic repressor
MFSIIVLEKARASQKIKDESVKKIQIAIDALSYSEVQAAKRILNNIENDEGYVVASKIADEFEITRSIIVNALRKLESAGLLKSKSLGMKGTHIKIINKDLKKILNIRD